MSDLVGDFCGVWELDPATLNYQQGRPGRRAVYTIARTAEGLEFTLDAEDADGKPMHFTYGGKLDGTPHTMPGTPLSIALTVLDDGSIESTAFMDGVAIDRWTRTLGADRTAMLVCQHGTGGKTFTNSGLYRRVR